MKTERVISARSTMFGKWVFGPIWVLGFGAGTLVSWIDPQGLVAADPGGSTGRWEITLAFVVGTLLVYWIGFSQKRVVLTQEGLRISGYFRKETIPFGLIEEVDQWIWFHPKTVTLTFRRPTGFGMRARFIPRTGWLPTGPGAEDDLVQELRTLASAGALTPQFAVPNEPT